MHPTDSPAPKPVTLKTLADHLHLSTATISIVLNRKPTAKGIPPETQQRIFEAAAAFGYAPNRIAQSLRSQRSASIGVIAAEIGENYAGEVTAGIEAELLKAGYTCLLSGIHPEDHTIEETIARLAQRQVEGLVTIAVPLDTPPSLPTVAVAGTCHADGVLQIRIDHHLAAQQVLAHLRDLGHRSLAVVKGQPGSIDTEDRRQAIEEQAPRFGFDLSPERIFELHGDPRIHLYSPGVDYIQGRRCGRRILAGRTLPTAVFAYNDASALGLIKTFQESGYRVPEDISVVGFDDIWNAATSSPTLTTVRQPLKQLGVSAAEGMLRLLSGEQTGTECLKIAPQLVIRDSTGPTRALSAA